MRCTPPPRDSRPRRTGTGIRSTHEVAAALAVGLTAARAAELLAANGPDALTGEKPKPGWRRFLEQYTTATRGAGRLLRAAGTSGKGQARGRARRARRAARTR